MAQLSPETDPQSQPVLRYCVGENQYGRYCVPLSSSHRPAAKAILAGEAYEPQTIEFILAHVGEGDVVHAGTYFGDFLPAISGACAAGARVWAFEPNPENCRCAAMTCRMNELKNVDLRQAALGAAAGYGFLQTADPTGRALGGASRVLAGGAESAVRHVEKIPIVSIDEIVTSSRIVSIIHLDVEGQEREALSGALHTIRRSLPILILENLPANEWLSTNILSLGYRAGPRLHANTVLLPRTA